MTPLPENKFLSTTRSVINAKYSVPTWLWVIASIFVALAITGVAIFDPLSATEFLDALPWGGLLIGPLLTGAGGLTMLGMILNRVKYVKWGSFASFCIWVFVGFAFFTTGGFLNFVILPLPMLCFWAYKYLASYVREHDQI